MSYTYKTLTQAQADLSSRLYESTGVQWPIAELTLYLQEAIRAWNSLTSFWRGTFAFSLSSAQSWYDLTSQAGTLRPMTVTDNLLLRQIEAHLLEPGTPNYPLVWAGSSQFSIQAILSDIAEKRDEVLAETGCYLSEGTVTAGSGRTVLTDSTLTIRRVAWLPTGTAAYTAAPLQQSDVWAQRAFDSNWTTAAQGQPTVWMQSSEPSLSFDVNRVPPCAGNYDVVTVKAGPTLSTTAATILGVPDDWSWVVKFGALACLFGQEGLAKDSLRAGYCEQRYQEGLKLMRAASALLEIRINNIPLWVDSVYNADRFNPNWQGAAPGPPTSCYVMGLNLIAFGPPPDAGSYSCSATVVQNAPVPVNAGDYIQVARSDYDSVLDESQHLAMLKAGGAEFLATIPMHQSFLRRAALYNQTLEPMGFFKKPMFELSQLEEERNPTVEVES